MIATSAWEALVAAVGPARVQRDVPASLLDDPTGLYVGSAAAVATPTDTAQVQAVVRAARAHGLRLVVRGGGTGLVGGAVAQGEEVVLDVSRLRAPLSVDPLERTVTAGAGVTVAQVQEALAVQGLWLPLELGSWQSATVGGVVATNAGGSQVLRHGHVRQLLSGVEAVLGTGEVISRLHGWRKDNNGPDLSALLCGSEGTLGVVTAATFRVVALPRDGVLLGLLLPSWDALVSAAVTCRDHEGVRAVEMVTQGARVLLTELPRAPFVGLDGHLLLVSAAARDAEDLVHAVAHLTTDVVVAQSTTEQASLWSVRHAVAEAVRRRGRPHKLDLSVPLAAMSAFLPEVGRLVTALRPEAVPVLFGHLADGNVHVNLVNVAEDDDEVDDRVVDLALEHGGHASAEHGIGVAKGRWLARTRSQAELAVQEQLRDVFDPDGVLNPRVLRRAPVMEGSAL